MRRLLQLWSYNRAGHRSVHVSLQRIYLLFMMIMMILIKIISIELTYCDDRYDAGGFFLPFAVTGTAILLSGCLVLFITDVSCIKDHYQIIVRVTRLTLSLRYESSTLILYKELSSSIFQSCLSVSQSGIGNTCPDLHFLQYIKA